MGHLNILKRAGHILWRYKALWLFGVLLALTVTSGAGSSQGAGSFDSHKDVPQEFQFEPPAEWRDFQERDWEELWEDFPGEIEREFERHVSPGFVGVLIVVGIGLVLVGFVFFIVGRVVRYVAEVAVIRMVNGYEDTGKTLRFRAGWRLGWSRAAWKSFLIDLAVTIPVVLLFIILLFIGLAPLMLWAGGRTVAGVLGTISSIGMSFLFIFFGVIVITVVKLFKNFFFRVCALENAGVRDSIKIGYGMVRHNLKDVGLMWLVMVGLNIIWRIVLIPLTLLLVAISAVIGGGVLVVTRLLSGVILHATAAWILGGVVGGPIFIILFVLPLLFVEGLKLVYVSNVWTLSYRELNALDSLAVPLDEVSPAADDADMILEGSLAQPDESVEGAG